MNRWSHSAADVYASGLMGGFTAWGGAYDLPSDPVIDRLETERKRRALETDSIRSRLRNREMKRRAR